MGQGEMVRRQQITNNKRDKRKKKHWRYDATIKRERREKNEEKR